MPGGRRPAPSAPTRRTVAVAWRPDSYVPSRRVSATVVTPFPARHRDQPRAIRLYESIAFTLRRRTTIPLLRVRSIRTAEGAIAFPTPEEARAHAWSDADRVLVQDRVDTQFVGSPARVADQLEQLQEATGADELLITTITHDHADRVRSYELLAEEWRRRG
ncbi:alkanesulfonate monooxygenase SsuD/methylene tetrahydromethanopterin reductase-like flavin-dependent oxidoreductase (luciferase family) [Streptomyces sp. V4I2]|nr:hypothetical protein [Streptomyces sp. V4I2]MDQ1045031.1 alkanesulfonate monooxygenase SsuD/methylene tetrahydromethanopterin reductase-like flavin-dependent oxidoreductase (luciferase family) [Streptomyces sp. V4I2]